MEQINEQQLRLWYDVLKDNKELVEIRVLDKSKNRTFSGYFTDIETIIKELKPHQYSDIYFTLNDINPACYSREQRDHFVMRPKSTTSDSDIIGRSWALIDIDCKKPSDTNSTDEEKAAAKKVAGDVYRFLLSQGFSKPIVADSCNGYHILIKMQLANTMETNTLMKNFLQTLSMLYSNEVVEIDLSVFNPSRICKLYSTYGRKGSNTKERPQRQSSILTVPDEIKITDIEYFRKVVSLLPTKEVPCKGNNHYVGNFSLDDFIAKHGIQVSQIQSVAGGTKYILDHCVFDSNHRGKDAMLFLRSDGAIGYHCFHSSCQNYTFKDVRLMFEPDAYDKKEYKEFQQKRIYNTPYNERIKPNFIKQEESIDDKGKKWMNLSDIEDKDISELIFIPTGYYQMDKAIRGLFMGEVTVLSGNNGCGKTSWLTCVTLNAIQRGFKVALWSGEMKSDTIKKWHHQIAAGKNHVEKVEGWDNYYVVNKRIGKKIDEWTEGKLFVYNHNYGNKWAQLFEDIKEVVEKQGVQMIVLDNLMALSLLEYEGTQYNQQTAFINAIKEYAKMNDVTFVLVAHPRKSLGFLRKESISGTADLTNLADNVFILHRNNKDFEIRAKEHFNALEVDNMLKYSTVIEICKNRAMGVIDKVYGMYYEQESRRLKNEISEHIIYNWEEQGEQTNIHFPNNEFVNNDFEDMPNFDDYDDLPI